MTDNYQRIANAIAFLRQQAPQQPSLEDVARHAGLSASHFQRIFKEYVGISPKRFVQYLTGTEAKKLLASSLPLLETSFELGLSSPSRLHDLLINVEAVTPGEFRNLGEGLHIHYGFHDTPFGTCLIAVTGRGVCCLEFIDSDQPGAVAKLVSTWPNAAILQNQEKTASAVAQIFTLPKNSKQKPISLFIKGTNFQLKVWQALLKIPEGSVTTYGYLAEKIGQPQASRAVGSAVGKNPIGYLIPCHRVLRADGQTGGYRWGCERKLMILGRELDRSRVS